MNCTHQFIEIDKVSKPTEVSFRTMFGSKLGCALCGQIRHLWPDGLVEVVIKGKQIEEDDRNKKRE